MGSRKNQRHLVHRQNIHARQALFKNCAGKGSGQIYSGQNIMKCVCVWGWGWGYSLFEYVQFLRVCPGEVRMVGHQVHSMRHSILWEYCVRVLCEKTRLQRIYTNALIDRPFATECCFKYSLLFSTLATIILRYCKKRLL